MGQQGRSLSKRLITGRNPFRQVGNGRLPVLSSGINLGTSCFHLGRNLRAHYEPLLPLALFSAKIGFLFFPLLQLNDLGQNLFPL